MRLAAVVTGPADVVRTAGVDVSATVPQAWHSPHRPTHFVLAQPHSPQRNVARSRVVFVAAGMPANLGGGSDMTGQARGSRPAARSSASARARARRSSRPPTTNGPTRENISSVMPNQGGSA